MISATVCQSVLPSASSRATSGSRVSSASAWPTILLAAITDMFIAAETSAHVRVNPVINAYPGSSDDVPSASQVRCHNRAATAAIRREMTMDSSRWQSSISPSKAFGETMSNIRSIMPLPTDARRSYPQADFLEFRAVVPLSAYASQMNGAAYVGRVGSLAVALGVGAVLLTGPRVAWAETPGDSPSSPSSSSESPSGAQAQNSTEPSGPSTPSAEPTTDPAATPAEPSPTVSSPSTSTPSASTGSTVTSAPPGVVVSTGGAHTSDTEETEEPTDPAVEPEPTANVHESVPSHVTSLAAQTMSSAANIQAAATSEPTVPSLRPWPTAFDPLTAVTYVTGLVTGFVNALLSPFASGLPALPTDPSPWALLAWVRRELFNESPTVTPVINPQTNGLITGNVGAVDPDGDALTYTVIGRPQNGGTLEIDQDGNFTYRPMNAMSAVGGVVQITVVVSDEAAGFHVHGPLGLLKLVPILGNFIIPGGGDAVAQTITVNVDPVAGVDLSFPASFHWGVATAGFQAEGGPGSPIDPNSDWYKWVHDPINQLLGLTHGVPENGPGTYVSYDGDAQLAHDELGMNTFRMSIEWSRIFQSSTAGVDISDEDGTVSLADLQALDALANQAEVQHYRDVFDSLIDHHLEPLITVNHFTLPAWANDPTQTRLLAQFGLPAPTAGWLSPSTPAEFEKYAAYVAWKYGDQVDNWTVLNEPVPPVLTQYLSIPGVVPSWPPGVIRPDLASTFLVNEAKGYVAAYDAIHTWDTVIATPGQPKAFVGFANNMIPARPANPVNPLDVQAANAWNDFYNNWFPRAVIDGLAGR